MWTGVGRKAVEEGEMGAGNQGAEGAAFSELS